MQRCCSVYAVCVVEQSVDGEHCNKSRPFFSCLSCHIERMFANTVRLACCAALGVFSSLVQPCRSLLSLYTWNIVTANCPYLRYFPLIFIVHTIPQICFPCALYAEISMPRPSSTSNPILFCPQEPCLLSPRPGITPYHTV